MSGAGNLFFDRAPSPGVVFGCFWQTSGDRPVAIF